MIARQNYANRVRTGKTGEQQIAQSLQDVFGLTIEEVSEDQDRFEKIDRIVVSGSGNRKTLQIKYRETGEDILVDVFEPFFGINHPRTGKGRDYVSKCDLYACRVGPLIHLIHGAALRAVIEIVLAEWRTAGCPSSGTFIGSQGEQIKIRKDHASERPKLLMFIPVKAINPESVWTKNFLTHKQAA